MFRWTLMLRKLFCAPSQRLFSNGHLFRLQREQPKSRRTRPTVKPELEELTDRIMPSISSVATLPASQPMAAAMDQWSHAIAAVQSELNSIWQTITQEIAQEVSYIEQQWDHLLGINQNT